MLLLGTQLHYYLHALDHALCDVYAHVQDIILDKFALNGPSCVAYDEKMDFYSTVIEDMKMYQLDKEVEFAVLHMGPLARGLQENARCWVTSLGKLLRESAKDSLMALNQQLTVN